MDGLLGSGRKGVEVTLSWCCRGAAVAGWCRGVAPAVVVLIAAGLLSGCGSGSAGAGREIASTVTQAGGPPSGAFPVTSGPAGGLPSAGRVATQAPSSRAATEPQLTDRDRFCLYCHSHCVIDGYHVARGIPDQRT